MTGDPRDPPNDSDEKVILLIADRPDETVEEAIARAGLTEAVGKGKTVHLIHTGVRSHGNVETSARRETAAVQRIGFAHSDRPDSARKFSVAEPLTASSRDGTPVTGILWLLPTRRGGFWVEYNGHWKTDGRADYIDEGYIKAIARIILREMAEAERRDEVGPTSGTA